MMTPPEEKRSWLTAGIVLAALPVMAYALAFGFEYGYYFAYGFPSELISIDLNRLLIAGLIIVAWLLLLLIPTTVVLAILPSAHPLTPAIAQAVTFILAYFFFLSFFGQLGTFGWIFGLLLLWYLIYKFALPLVTQRSVRGYVHKFRHREQARQAQATMFRTTLRTLGPTPGMVLVYFFIAFVLSVTFGWYLATAREFYFVVQDPPERVVLRIYGDSMILARLDRPGRQIVREYTVLRRMANPIILREERIGPLTVAH